MNVQIESYTYYLRFISNGTLPDLRYDVHYQVVTLSNDFEEVFSCENYLHLIDLTISFIIVIYECVSFSLGKIESDQLKNDYLLSK